MTLYANEKNPVKQFGGLASVILLHLLIVYVLVSGASRIAVTMINPPLDVKLLEEIKPPPPPEDLRLRPPPPKLIPPAPLFIPLPEVQVAQPQQQQEPVIADVVHAEPEQPPPPIQRTDPPGSVMTGAVFEYNGCEVLEYPWIAQRDRQEGPVLLALLIGTDGRVLESKVEKSSGFPLLDEAARTGMALCPFKPATIDGKPRQAWKKIRYVWNLAY